MDTLIEMLRDRGARRLKVALDVDETIADIAGLMFDNFNRAKGTNYSVEDHKDYSFKNIGSSYEEMMPFYAQVWKERHREISFLGDLGQITELTRHYKVDILTTRSATGEGVTGGTMDNMNDWLRIHQLDRLKVVICDPKLDKALNFDYQVYIDDSPRLASSVESVEGKFMFMIRRNYNSNIEASSKILPVKDVNEAIGLLVELARRDLRRRARAS